MILMPDDPSGPDDPDDPGDPDDSDQHRLLCHLVMMNPMMI